MTDRESAFNIDRNAALDDLRRLYEEAEREHHDALAPPALRENIARMADLIGLGEIECRILELVVLIQTDVVLAEACATMMPQQEWGESIPSFQPPVSSLRSAPAAAALHR